MLEEVGLPYTLKMWPFPPRLHSREYLEINPLGTVPTMFDGAVRMTESAAICQYIAARYSPNALDVAVDDPGYGDYLNYLHLGEATLTFPQTLVLRYSRFELPERRQPQVVQDYAKWFIARLRGLASHLEQREFIAAGRFTAADVSVGYALLLGEHIHVGSQYPASVMAYWARLRERPAYLRSLDAQQKAAIDQDVSPEAPSVER